MKILFFSDTHSQHKLLSLPDADIIVFCGDMASMGRKYEIEGFFTWFNKLPHKHKVCIGGNHDFFLDYGYHQYTEMGRRRHTHAKPTKLEVDELINKFPNINYLMDSSVTIEGIKFWGSPMTPWFHDWAFNRMRGADIDKHWSEIPNDVEILITHGPPSNTGFLERTLGGENVGCDDLWARIQTLHKLKVNCFGHIHEGCGHKKIANVDYVNASVLDINYQLKHNGVLVEYDNGITDMKWV